MLMSPSSLLARLDELKKWQQTQQERLIKQHQERLQQTSSLNSSNSDNLGVSALDVKNETLYSNFEHLPSPQNFDALLEQKLQEEESGNTANVIKPKRPFLRKGSGLSRYRMTLGDPKKAFIKGKANISNKKIEPKVKAKKNPIYSDLKMPEMDFRPKATWCKVTEDEQTPLSSKCENKTSGCINSFNQNVIAHINAFTAQRMKKNEQQPTVEGKNNLPLAEQSSGPYSDKELLIFENLEKRVLNSSFSSTSSSIMRMLSSTPQKTSPVKEHKRTVQFSEPICVGQNSTTVEEKRNEENSKSVNDSEIIEQLIYNQVQQGNIAELLSKLQILRQKSQELFESTQTPTGHHSISSDSSINSDDIQNCIEDVKFNKNENWSSPSESNEDETQSACSRAESPVNNQEQPEIFKKDAATNTGSLNDLSEVDDNDTTLASEDSKMLAEKLQELNREIERFRTENAKVTKMRKELETEQADFNKEKKKLLKEIEDEKIRINFNLEEEKKKLAKERMVFEKYVKEYKDKPNKQERTEISNLKIEVANLKETQKLKDTKNSTTQARLRNQIKNLEKENANLKDEVEKLTKQNARLTAAQKINRRPSDTKMLHEINKNLTKLTQESKGLKSAQKTKEITTEESESEPEVVRLKSNKKNKQRRNSVSENSKGLSGKQSVVFDDSFEDKRAEVSVKERSQRYSGTNEEFESRTEQNFKENDKNFINIEDGDIEKSYEQVFGINTSGSRSSLSDSRKSLDRVETVLSDGSKEIKYSNGNLKIVSSDGSLIKTNYYNGDIKETDLLQGHIKYYYFETNTWHTTYTDGSEILEFPNGQIEKKFKDGTSEIQFPDGVIKKSKIDGSQDTIYADGSVVTIFPDGHKILLLPNGQKEVHTKDHMRREYPDGTVKILYPDGTQETRYANGRVRLKDKEGKLLMDSFA